jgi:hypothetical protein
MSIGFSKLLWKEAFDLDPYEVCFFGEFRLFIDFLEEFL